jgi:hypothetical protein
MTKDNDPIRLNLAKTKLGAFSVQSVLSLVKDRKHLEEIRSQFSNLHGGDTAK